MLCTGMFIEGFDFINIIMLKSLAQWCLSLIISCIMRLCNH